MNSEEIKVGDYVTVAGSIRCKCMDAKDGAYKDCDLCVFEDTQRCLRLRCEASTRSNKRMFFFVVRLNDER